MHSAGASQVRRAKRDEEAVFAVMVWQEFRNINSERLAGSASTSHPSTNGRRRSGKYIRSILLPADLELTQTIGALRGNYRSVLVRGYSANGPHLSKRGAFVFGGRHPATNDPAWRRLVFPAPLPKGAPAV
ncbi:uncharacterized protein LOC142776721 [Rhipicephalus microplus]|uniref:uncharacterized protein LOC142776721 n=1 Tax=Rhipicephalus microplus TaxID=6941 RepID=UPI003F6CBA97